MKHLEHPLNNRFFIVETGSLDFLNVLQSGSFRKCSLNGSLGNQKWFFYGITAKTLFWNLYILRVYKALWQKSHIHVLNDDAPHASGFAGNEVIFI